MTPSDPAFPYLRLHLVLEPERSSDREEAELPAPLLRRVLGRALVDRFCPFGEPLCQARDRRGAPRAAPADLCALAGHCPYGVLFAASSSARPPYALFVPDRSSAPAAHRAEITLAGPAWRLYPWALLALRDALARGTGRDRRRWRLAGVLRVRPDRSRERLCGADLAGLPADLSPDALDLRPQAGPPPPAVEVRFASPARLLLDGRLIGGRAPIPFQVLLARILDRLAGLYGPTLDALVPADARAALVERAASVPLLECVAPWVEVHDYSARSSSELLLGGKVGRAVYGAGAGALLPLLRAGEAVGVGKNTASGNGRIEVDGLEAVPAGEEGRQDGVGDAGGGRVDSP